MIHLLLACASLTSAAAKVHCHRALVEGYHAAPKLPLAAALVRDHLQPALGITLLPSLLMDLSRESLLRRDHRPNLRDERAFALAASFSLSLGAAVVSSEASNRSEIFAMSSTAE